MDGWTVTDHGIYSAHSLSIMHIYVSFLFSKNSRRFFYFLRNYVNNLASIQTNKCYFILDSGSDDISVCL
ncbi:hypothetical protein DERP_002587 [Dermatophagoides pteronyssinus]|uniref:Uncharacterized protein n=1 Tax=Dermatophagoides pteronyssinus TaxID=6956 RepID=A0ABQ8JIS4_DERPT|nr:hypothetical protein DERP_002587 [Dermatophagoides pteronyssinus]